MILSGCKIMELNFLILIGLLSVTDSQIVKTYDMDEKATCGRTIYVDDSGVRLNGRGNVAPSQPPLECIVYLQSVYSQDDGSNKLQVEVESLTIKDCNVVVNLYNGRNSVGRTLQVLACQYSSVGIVYSNSREVTVVLKRPDILVHNEYQFRLLIKPYKDQDHPGTRTGVSSLSVAAIIGIIIGCLILLALIILFLWCCCTGRLGNFNIPGRSISKGGAKSNAEIMKDPHVWNSETKADNITPAAPRLYQRGRPRNSSSGNYLGGRQFDSQGDTYTNGRPDVYGRHEYEPYNTQKEQQAETQRRSNQRKETLIDDVFDSDSNTKDTELDVEEDDAMVDENTLQKRPQRRWSPRSKRKGEGQVSSEEGEQGGDSPKSKRKVEGQVPEVERLDRDSPQLERYKSMDLQSQPDLETIASPHHINAGVRASVEDIEPLSQQGTLNKKGQKSPRAKRKEREGGRAPDPMAMPPEAFEPIFTAPITGINYKSNQPNPQGYGMIPQGYPPSYLVPAGMLAPGVPGTQTYAYAYQTVPPGGVPGQQGAWLVQNTPTTDGNRRTAYVMEETIGGGAPRGGNRQQRGSLTPESKRRNNKQGRDPFGPTRDSDRWGGKDNRGPDLSIVARGAAPPDPGQGHRSVAMKSGTDPHTGIHTTQVVWKDTAPDPSDPKPGDNPQVTRKTVTRVTTKSGYGDLPPETNPLMVLDGQEEEPAFLSPSRGRHNMQQQGGLILAPPAPSLSAAIETPDRENVDFYTGPARNGRGDYLDNSDRHHTVPPPDRTSTPQSFSVHQHPPYNVAIRDRIPIDDSTV